jgi:hypothetical protein
MTLNFFFFFFFLIHLQVSLLHKLKLAKVVGGRLGNLGLTNKNGYE